MARINYADKAARTRERYLYPEEDRVGMSDIAIPALSFLLFATPLGGKLISGAMGKIGKPLGKMMPKGPGGAKGAWGAAKGSLKGLAENAKTSAKSVREWWKSGAEGRLNASNRVANWVEGKGKQAFSALSGVSENPFPGASNAIRFIGKHPGKIALGAGAFGALSAMAPRGGKHPIADIGMGYPEGTTWTRRDRKPLRPGHLGATGDLVFALRDGR